MKSKEYERLKAEIDLDRQKAIEGLNYKFAEQARAIAANRGDVVGYSGCQIIVKEVRVSVITSPSWMCEPAIIKVFYRGVGLTKKLAPRKDGDWYEVSQDADTFKVIKRSKVNGK